MIKWANLLLLEIYCLFWTKLSFLFETQYFMFLILSFRLFGSKCHTKSGFSWLTSSARKCCRYEKAANLGPLQHEFTQCQAGNFVGNRYYIWFFFPYILTVEKNTLTSNWQRSLIDLGDGLLRIFNH